MILYGGAVMACQKGKKPAERAVAVLSALFYGGVFIVVVLISFGAFSAPAAADENAVPPLPPEMRARFDQVMAGLWHDDCGCWRFLFEGKVKEIHPPLTDKDRWAIMGTIERGELLPVERNKGQAL